MRVNLTSWEVIKLMMACTAAAESVEGYTSKKMWNELHDKLNEALKKEEEKCSRI